MASIKSYSFYSGLDDQQKYNIARDENARKEAAAELDREKAMRALFTTQAAEERTATLFSSQEAARRLAEAQATAGLGALTAELPVLQAERALTNRRRTSATELGNANFEQTQAGLATTEGLKIKERGLINSQIAKDQEVRTMFPSMTDPNMRKRIADLLSLGISVDQLATIAPDAVPFMSSVPLAQAVATIPNPSTFVANSYNLSQRDASKALEAAGKGEQTLGAIEAKGQAALELEKARAANKAAAAATKSAITGGAGNPGNIPPFQGAATSAKTTPVAPQTAVPIAAAPATPPTKATAAPAPATTAVEAAGQQLDAARLALKQLQDSPRPGLAAGAKAMQAYSDRLREAQRAVSVSELTYQQLLPPQLATFRATR